MERSGAEDAVELPLEWQVQHIAANELHPAAEIGFEVSTSCIDHVLGEIERHHTPAGQSLQEIAGQPAGAAAGVEKNFISTQGNASEHFLSPADLRRGDFVVNGGVPFAG